MNANNHKTKKYNLYYIISEKIEKEPVPLKLYYDVLVTVMKRVEKLQCEELKENNEQRNID